MTSATDERALQAVAARALELIGDGAGWASAGSARRRTFIAQLGKRVRQGLRVAGVPTSEASGASPARSASPSSSSTRRWSLDLTVDGRRRGDARPGPGQGPRRPRCAAHRGLGLEAPGHPRGADKLVGALESVGRSPSSDPTRARP